MVLNPNHVQGTHLANVLLTYIESQISIAPGRGMEVIFHHLMEKMMEICCGITMFFFFLSFPLSPKDGFHRWIPQSDANPDSISLIFGLSKHALSLRITYTILFHHSNMERQYLRIHVLVMIKVRQKKKKKIHMVQGEKNRLLH